MATAKSSSDRQTLDRHAAERGWRIEGGGDQGFRIVNTVTGTVVAGRWTNVDCFGLSADEVATIVTAVA